MGNASDVKQFDHVVYKIGDRSYDAVALAAPVLGYNPAHRQASHCLILIYLDDQGVPTRVAGAPLLTEAAGTEDLETYAKLTVVERMGRGRTDQEHAERIEAASTEYERLRTEPRTTGWMPVALAAAPANPDVEKLNTQLAALVKGPDREFVDHIMPHLAALSMTVAKIAPHMEISPDGTLISAKTLLESMSAALPAAVQPKSPSMMDDVLVAQKAGEPGAGEEINAGEDGFGEGTDRSGRPTSAASASSPTEAAVSSSQAPPTSTDAPTEGSTGESHLAQEGNFLHKVEEKLEEVEGEVGEAIGQAFENR